MLPINTLPIFWNSRSKCFERKHKIVVNCKNPMSNEHNMVTSRIANSGFPRANLRITSIQFENCYCTFEMFFFLF